MYNSIICDIDGCLALFPPGRRFEFDEIEECERILQENEPYHSMINLVKFLHSSKEYCVILMTARPERFRTVTEGWLLRHGVPYDKLIMRSESQLQFSDSDVKRHLYLNLKRKGHKVHFVIEDRHSVVAMWRAQGLLCLQPANTE